MIRFERAVLDGGVSTPLAISEKVRRWGHEPVKDYVQRVLAEDSKVLGVTQEEVEEKLSEVISSTVADGAYLEGDLRSLPYPHNLIRAEHAQAHLELTQWLSKTIVVNYPMYQVGHILLDHRQAGPIDKEQGSLSIPPKPEHEKQSYLTLLQELADDVLSLVCKETEPSEMVKGLKVFLKPSKWCFFNDNYPIESESESKRTGALLFYIDTKRFVIELCLAITYEDFPTSKTPK